MEIFCLDSSKEKKKVQIKLKIIKCKCSKCGKTFFEWEDFLLERCPHCCADLSGSESADEVGSKIVGAELDLLTGRIQIVGISKG